MQVVASFGQPPVVCIRTDSGYGVVSVFWLSEYPVYNLQTQETSL